MLSQEERVNRLRDLLIASCDQHLQSGKDIIYGAFGVFDGSCCPIKCAVGTAQRFAPSTTNGDRYAVALSIKLGFQLEDDEMWEFIDGFDGNDVEDQVANSPMYQLGQELRKKYILDPKKAVEKSNG